MWRRDTRSRDGRCSSDPHPCLLPWLSAVVGVALLTAAGGCSSPENENVWTVFAAASTIDVMTEMLSEFEQVHDVRLRVTYGSSSSLSAMILHGVEFDLFVSANVEWANRVEQSLASRGIIFEATDLMSNRLVVVVDEDDTRDLIKDGMLESLADLPAAGFRNIAIADPLGVPAGMYARQALVSAGVWEQIQPLLVTAGDVRAALAMVELGAAEAAIVYATDAAVSSRVRVELEIPESEQPAIVYRVISIADPEQRAIEGKLLRFMTSSAAAEVLSKHGFVPLSESSGGEQP